MSGAAGTGAGAVVKKTKKQLSEERDTLKVQIDALLAALPSLLGTPDMHVKALEVEGFKVQLAELDKNIAVEDLTEKLKTRVAMGVQGQQEIGNLKAELAAEVAKNKEAEEKLIRATQMNRALSAEVGKLQTEVERLKAWVGTLVSERDDRKDKPAAVKTPSEVVSGGASVGAGAGESAGLPVTQEGLAKKHAELRTKAISCKETHKALLDSLNSYTGERTGEEYWKKRDEVGRAKAAYQSALLDMRFNELRALLSQRDDLQAQSADKSQEIIKLQAEVERLKAAPPAASSEVVSGGASAGAGESAGLQKVINKKDAEIQKLKTALQTAKQTLGERDKRIQDLEVLPGRLKKARSEMRSMAKAHESENKKAVKAVAGLSAEIRKLKVEIERLKRENGAFHIIDQVTYEASLKLERRLELADEALERRAEEARGTDFIIAQLRELLEQAYNDTLKYWNALCVSERKIGGLIEENALLSDRLIRQGGERARTSVPFAGFAKMDLGSVRVFVPASEDGRPPSAGSEGSAGVSPEKS